MYIAICDILISFYRATYFIQYILAIYFLLISYIEINKHLLYRYQSKRIRNMGMQDNSLGKLWKKRHYDVISILIDAYVL